MPNPETVFFPAIDIKYSCCALVGCVVSTNFVLPSPRGSQDGILQSKNFQYFRNQLENFLQIRGRLSINQLKFAGM